MDGVILVTAPRQTQVERLVMRNGMTKAQAEARVDAQLPLSQKIAHATWVIDNGGTLENTRQQVERLWRQISGYAPPPS
jgi:dephospho-CoA kinase